MTVSDVFRRCGLLLAAALMALLTPIHPAAQQVGRVAAEIRVPEPPTIATALGRQHLVYEVHVTNFGFGPSRFRQLDVIDGETSAPIASWQGAALWQRLTIVGQAAPLAREEQQLQPGARAVIYIWITLPAGAKVPASVRHRVTWTVPASPARCQQKPAFQLAVRARPSIGGSNRHDLR